MHIYESIHQFNMWADLKSINGYPNASTSPILNMDATLYNQSDDMSQGTLGSSPKFDYEAARPDKVRSRFSKQCSSALDLCVHKLVLRRQAQNREAARKSRIRKKAYVKQLESSRLKLIQMELELENTRQQGMFVGGGLDATPLGHSGNLNSGIVTFLVEYDHWMQEQNRQTGNIRMALSSIIVDVELAILVEDCMKHYYALFALKANAAKADVFYLMSGMWKTPAERFFLWIGGFRPSEILQVLLPQLDLTDQHIFFNICNLRQSCQQAEDALSQGMDKLQQTLIETIAGGRLCEGNNIVPLHMAMGKLEALVIFIDQADHLRQETLEQMCRLLTTRQAAKGLLVLGEYCQRLRALSILWEAQLHQPALS